MLLLRISVTLGSSGNFSLASCHRCNALKEIYCGFGVCDYFGKSASLSKLVAWVNVIWFTELYEYDSKEENAITSVMALLETLDEGVAFTPEEYAEMIECLEANRDCKL